MPPKGPRKSKAERRGRREAERRAERRPREIEAGNPLRALAWVLAARPHPLGALGPGPSPWRPYSDPHALWFVELTLDAEMRMRRLARLLGVPRRALRKPCYQGRTPLSHCVSRHSIPSGVLELALQTEMRLDAWRVEPWGGSLLFHAMHCFARGSARKVELLLGTCAREQLFHANLDSCFDNPFANNAGLRDDPWHEARAEERAKIALLRSARACDAAALGQ